MQRIEMQHSIEGNVTTYIFSETGGLIGQLQSDQVRHRSYESSVKGMEEFCEKHYPTVPITHIWVDV